MRETYEAAKNASTDLIKCFSSPDKLAQCLVSLDKSISSAVQNEACAFLYISQMDWYLIGNKTNRLGLGINNGSSSSRVAWEGSRARADIGIGAAITQEMRGDTGEDEPSRHGPRMTTNPPTNMNQGHPAWENKATSGTVPRTNRV